MARDSSFAQVPSGTSGPYLALAPRAALAIWAETASPGGWFTRALHQDGQGRSAARRVAELEAPPELVRVREFGSGTLVAWSESGANGALHLLRLGPDGELASPPQRLTRTGTPAIWLDFVPTQEGGLLFWAERTASGAILSAQAIDQAGAPTAHESPLPGRARAWQVVSSPRGAVVATVNERRGVTLLEVSAAGEVLNIREVAGLERAGSELDLVRLEDRLLLAVTASPAASSHVFVTAAEPDGTPVGNVRLAVAPRGEQSLIRLVADDERAYLVWSDTEQDPGVLKVSALGADGSAAGTPLLVPWNAAEPPPEFGVSDGLLQALVWACVERLDCSEPRVPVQVELDAALAPIGVHPWLLQGRPPDLAWDFSCRGGRCLGLAAAFDEATRVHALGAATEPGEWVTPVWPEPNDLPRAHELVSTMELPPLSAFDVLPGARGSLVAWLSYFDPALPYVVPKQPAPDGRKAPVQAQLRTQWVPDDLGSPGVTLPAENVISYRARSPGGVSLARGEKGHLLAWAAIDGKHPQVFTTLLDLSGKKVAQQMLTRQSGEVSEVTTATAGNEWLIGWIDDRTGTPRPYVTKLSERLARKLPDQVLGDSTTAASGIALARVGGEVWHLRADSHGKEEGGIELCRLDGRSLKVIAEVTLASGDAHYHTPRFIEGAARPMVAFVREGRTSAEVLVLNLDEQGQPLATPLRWKSSYDPVQFSARCEGSACALVATTESDQTQFLEALAFNEADVVRGRVVGHLRSAQALGIAPVLRGSEAWYYDVSVRGKPRLERMRISW